MPARDQRLLLGAALATSALLLLATLVGHADLLPYAAPFFLIAVPLLAGRYVGEERLERWRFGLRVRPAPSAARRAAAAIAPAGRFPYPAGRA